MRVEVTIAEARALLKGSRGRRKGRPASLSPASLEGWTETQL